MAAGGVDVLDSLRILTLHDALADCKLVYASGRTATITIHQLDGKGRIETAGRDLH